MRRLGTALGILGWLLLALAALAGVLLSGAVLFAASPFGRSFVASTLIRMADEAVAGRLELDGIRVLAKGGVEVDGLRVYDPDGDLVLSVGKARVFLDVTHLRARVLGVSVELDRPDVEVARGADGTVSLARAFAPSHPRPPPRAVGAPAAPRPARGQPRLAWTVRVTRLEIRDGQVRYREEDEAEPRLAAHDLRLDARGAYGPDGGHLELRARGTIDAPLAGPLELDVSAVQARDAIRVPILSVRLGDDVLDAVGEGDLARRTGRIAIARLGIERAEVDALLGRAALGGDLGATAYAESDGEVATVAAHLSPSSPDAGGADAAVAVRIPPALQAIGFDVAADRLDPAHLLTVAPSGRVTLTARGAVAGTTLETLRGHASVKLAPSRVRQGELGPVELVASGSGGNVDVERLFAVLPGATLRGAGRIRRGGAASAQATLDAGDLARLGRNLSGLLGRSLPELAGRARVEASASGSSDAPALRAVVDAPALRSGAVALRGVHLEAESSGPLRAPVARLDATAAALASGAEQVARAMFLRATLSRDEGTVALSASVPRLGRDPVSVEGRARLGPERRTLVVPELTLAYPTTRFTLVRPATVTFAGPSVDALELASGVQRIAIQGGLGSGGALDARLVLTQLELGGLPAGLLPASLRLGGALSLDARATGTTRRPRLDARLALARGTVVSLDGLDATGTFRYDGAARRVGVQLAAVRRAGGSLDLAADLPVPLAAARAGDRISASARGTGLPVEELVRAAQLDLPATGRLGIAAALSGTRGAPALQAQVQLADGTYVDLGDLAATVTLSDVGAHATVQAAISQAGDPIASAELGVPLDLGALLGRPGAARALRTAPLRGTVTVPGLELARLAGRFGVPEGIAGRLRATAAVSGTALAPRGKASADLEQGVYAGYSGVAAHLDLVAAADRVSAVGRAAIAGDEVLRLEGALAAPVERLGALARVPVRLDAVIPRVSLARATGQALPLSGTVEGKLAIRGTAETPELSLDLTGGALAVEGRPLGDLVASARYARGKGSAAVDVRAQAGGTLRARFAVDAPLGLGTSAEALRAAPATVTVKADALDLGFVPAVAPGLVRTASGKLLLDASATGPLARLRPRGTLRIQDGRLAVTEYGDWTGIEVDASATRDAIEVARLFARRGSGHVDAHGSLRGLAGGSAVLDAHATVSRLTLTRVGMELATVDLRADATGSYHPGLLEAKITVPSGTVKLPKKAPRTLQQIEQRPDIVVGRAPKKKKAGPKAGASGPGGEQALRVKVEVVVPGHFLVRSDDPRVNIELKGDVTLEQVGSAEYAEGAIDVVHGLVEPIGGRVFDLTRGRVQFTGGPPNAALLDVEAQYQNPAATVTVTISGPVSRPDIKLTSQPPMDETQIAMLIATGRTELRAGSGGVGTITGEEAGKAAVGVLATQLFKGVLADKLPLDTVSLDAGALRAGKYVTTKVYVAYIRRFDARPDQGENENEVRFEYQITPRWTLEWRYGDARSGDASLIWSKSY